MIIAITSTPFSFAHSVCPVVTKEVYRIGDTAHYVYEVKAYLAQNLGIYVTKSELFDELLYGATGAFQILHQDVILEPLGLSEPTYTWGPKTSEVAYTMCKEENNAQPAFLLICDELPTETLFPGDTGLSVTAITTFLAEYLDGRSVVVTDTYTETVRDHVRAYQQQHFDEIIVSQGFPGTTGIWGPKSIAVARELCPVLSSKISYPEPVEETTSPEILIEDIGTTTFPPEPLARASGIEVSCTEPFEEDLSMGDISLEVIKVQEFLSEVLERDLPTNGAYGPKTRDSIADFQEAYISEPYDLGRWDTTTREYANSFCRE